MLRPATKMSAIDFLSCLLSKASGITQGPRSAQRDVARSEAAEKCASLQRKNMTIPTGRRNHDQYRRFSHYEVIDFVAVLFGDAISGERTLEAFYEHLSPFASAFMALFGRERLPARSTLSRFLAALPSEPVEALRALFLSDLLARPLVPEGEPAGLWDRTGSQWQVFDIDGTREAARQRALPQGPERASHPSVAYVRSVLRATLGGSEEKLSAPEPRAGPRSYPSMARLVRWARQWLGTRGITPSRGPDPAVPCGPSVASSMRAARGSTDWMGPEPPSRTSRDWRWSCVAKTIRCFRKLRSSFGSPFPQISSSAVRKVLSCVRSMIALMSRWVQASSAVASW